MRKVDEIADSLSAPLENLIASIARGVAEAQQTMDMRTIESYKELYQGNDGLRKELQALGYQPTWYRIPELHAEMSISLSISGQSDTQGGALPNPSQGGRPVKIYAAPIDANYANRYNYDIRAASKITFKIVPVPPSAQAEQIRVVPQLVNKTAQEAEYLLGILNIGFNKDPDIPSTYYVKESVPAAGSMIRPGDVLTLSFSEKMVEEPKK